MKTVLFAIISFVIVSYSQSQTISDKIEAQAIGYHMVPVKFHTDFVRFTDYYSEVYEEIYDKAGNLIDIHYGGEVFTYTYVTEWKTYPVFTHEYWMDNDSTYKFFGNKK